jgi:hypothetical protein
MYGPLACVTIRCKLEYGGGGENMARDEGVGARRGKFWEMSHSERSAVAGTTAEESGFDSRSHLAVILDI